MRKLLIGICALLISGVFAINEADAAKRMGGGRNLGTQRSVTNTPPASVPAKPGQQQAAPAGQQATPAAAPASGFAKWAPLLGGLAIGGLLGSMFGGAFGGALGNILMIALLVVAAVLAFRFFMGRRQQGAPQTMQFAGTNERVTVPPSSQPAVPAGGGIAGATLPAGFDADGFVRAAKMNFVKLQAANDAGNLDEIREFTTVELFDELSKDVRERGGFAQQTDIVTVNAELLEVVTDGGKHWASVRFSGLEREAPGAEPAAFREVWTLSKPADGSSGWLLAGIQQMQ